MISSLPSIPKAVEAIRQKKLSPVDLVDFCLARIARFESDIRAWVFVDEEGARAEAKRLESLAQQGKILGPLHGIPIGIKDIVDVAGWPTKAGSPLRENHVAERDAELVTRLKQAGAIVLGKTVTTQFASFDPPITRNPWNLERTPGGSSSGSAAALALGMCMAAIGSQTGGSIIRPASYCGVVGLKPSLHAVSLEGVVPLSPSLDHAGPLGRSVADVAAVYDAIQRVVDGTSTNLLRVPPRLSWLKGLFWERADNSVKRVFEQAIKKLGDFVETRDWRGMPETFDQVLPDHRRIMAVEAAEFHRHDFSEKADQYGPRISELIREGLACAAVDYASSLRHQKAFSTQFQNALGAATLVMPSTTCPAPGLETTGDPSFNSPWSFAGVPAVTIPCGLDQAGMPCGIQLVSAKLDEQALLAVAARCEERLDFHAHPAMLSGGTT